MLEETIFKKTKVDYCVWDELEYGETRNGEEKWKSVQ